MLLDRTALEHVPWAMQDVADSVILSLTSLLRIYRPNSHFMQSLNLNLGVILRLENLPYRTFCFELRCKTHAALILPVQHPISSISPCNDRRMS